MAHFYLLSYSFYIVDLFKIQRYKRIIRGPQIVKRIKKEGTADMQASSLGPQSHKINKELEELTCGPKNWHPACGGTHSVFIGA